MVEFPLRPPKKMKKVFNANETANLAGWHKNTDLGCDVKTMLRSDRKMNMAW